MEVGPFVYFIRVVPPILLLWLAWIVYRAPFQEQGNRLFALFLFVISLGFLLEFVWFTTGLSSARPNPVGEGARTLQAILGKLDPPILLAAVLTFLGRRAAVRSPWLWAAYGTAALFLWGAERGGLPFGFVPTADTTLVLHALYVNGTYLVAFALLAHGYLSETRHYIRRRLGSIALAVGFAALSRSGVLFFSGGLPAVRLAITPTIFASLAVATALLLVLWVGLRTTSAGKRQPPTALFLALGSIVLVFHLLWFLSHLLDQAIGYGYSHLYNAYYPMRWLAVAAIMGYGSLRYQIFDFDLRVHQAVTLGAAIVVAVGVAIAAAAYVWGGPEKGWSLFEARLLGIAVGAAVFVPARWLIMRAAQRLLPVADGVVAWQKRRLEIYEATVEYALTKPASDPAERRFVETLREVFEVTPEEHDEVLERLRAQAKSPTVER